MSVRFYKMTWLVFLAIVALTYLTGNLTAVAGVVYGHIVFGLIFMGMMIVLPTSISHPVQPAKGPGMLKRIGSLFGGLKGQVHKTSHTWMSSNSVEVRHPKYH